MYICMYVCMHLVDFARDRCEKKSLWVLFLCTVISPERICHCSKVKWLPVITTKVTLTYRDVLCKCCYHEDVCIYQHIYEGYHFNCST